MEPYSNNNNFSKETRFDKQNCLYNFNLSSFKSKGPKTHAYIVVSLLYTAKVLVKNTITNVNNPCSMPCYSEILIQQSTIAMISFTHNSGNESIGKIPF